jgi:lantibiotic modifying enzyme
LEVVLGFAYGMAGVIYYQLEYAEKMKDAEVLASAEKGLTYLMKRAIRSKEGFEWPNSSICSERGIWWCHGGPGIALCFLKAFQLTTKEVYLHYAEMSLRKHPVHIMNFNLSQCHGLAGLGEIYLAAFKTTGKREWEERLIWIAELLCTLKFQDDNEGYYWITDKHTYPTAELMTGNAGILHFLLHFLHPGELSFPGLPCSSINR